MTAARTCLMIAFCCAFAASPGATQGKPDSETFLEAIEEQDNNKVVDLVTRKGRSIINVRGYSGATPLTMAMRKRSMQYVNYLLQNGADANLADKSGETAILIAARMGNFEGVNAMLAAKAAVDASNRQGETPLIVAVQNRHVQAIKRLLEAGGSTIRTDNAGLSARDYAARDRRSAEILKLFETVKKKPIFVAGPIIR
ncbi:MAG: ankyrin repeat domain-containing protein [Pseudomonadota bacterium]|nr:ankyrin repeat domain-containing protein [Pseudomonadota bacterium]